MAQDPKTPEKWLKPDGTLVIITRRGNLETWTEVNAGGSKSQVFAKLGGKS